MVTVERQAYAALDVLYGQVPEINCKGLCGTLACASWAMSPLEAQRITESGAQLPHRGGAGQCPLLGAFGQCTVYEIRPMVCRLWGTTPDLPVGGCPHGCGPRDALNRYRARALLESVDAVSRDTLGHE